VVITVVDTPSGTISSKSNYFNIIAATASQYAFTSIPDPVSAGEIVNIKVEARDAYGNIDTTYNHNASFTDIGPDSIAIITNPATVTFSNGIWEGTIKTDTSVSNNINKSGNQTQLQLNSITGQAITSNTNTFTVIAGSLHHFGFVVGPDPYVKVDSNIPVEIYAYDQYNNYVVFTGTATISDLTETVKEVADGDTTIAFTSTVTTSGYDAGVFSGDLVITSPKINNVIQVVSGNASGSSDPFTVVANNIFVELSSAPDAVTAPKIAIAGETISMFDFTVTNPNPTNNAVISSFEMYVESSRNGEAFTTIPSYLIQSISIYNITEGSEVLLGENSSPPATPTYVSVNAPVSINPSGGVVTIRAKVKLASNISRAEVPNIQLRIADITGNLDSIPAVPLDPTNLDFESIKEPGNYVRSGLTNIRSSEGKAAYNYPNCVLQPS